MQDEVIKRIEIQHQLLSLAVIAPGTILAIGLQNKNASLMLFYPLLGMFEASVWLSNSIVIHDLSPVRYTAASGRRPSKLGTGLRIYGYQTPLASALLGNERPLHWDRAGCIRSRDNARDVRYRSTYLSHHWQCQQFSHDYSVNTPAKKRSQVARSYSSLMHAALRER